MNILLIYYTGTYNTAYVTSLLKDRLLLSNNKVDSIEIDIDTKPIDLSRYDIIGFGYPIYAFNSPILFNKYLKKLKILKDKKYFVYKNSGETEELNNASSRVIKNLLKRKHAYLISEYHIVMPYNIHFRFDDAFVKEILLYLDKEIEIITNDLMHGKGVVIKSNRRNNMISKFYTIQRIGGFVNSFFYKIDYSKCVHCDLCLKNCPVHNIGIKNNKYTFGHHCQMCMRCSFFCPKDAIKIGIYDGWRVNGRYDFIKIKNNKNLKLPYINESSSGFYHCFIKTFKEIDERYNEINKQK